MLPEEFYKRTDVLTIARELLGSWLWVEDGICALITEVEAYSVEEKACHAYRYRRTHRNKPLYSAGGVAYVYLCYGCHCLLNIVTGIAEEPAAVLLRALQPVKGIEQMRSRRGLQKALDKLTAGPGMLTEAMGIDLSWNGESLLGPRLWVEEGTREEFLAGERVGVDYAGEDAKLPWRFMLADAKIANLCPEVSLQRRSPMVVNRQRDLQ